jgi:hypothetical protein
MALTNSLPFPVGSTATAVDAGLVGQLFQDDSGRRIRLCKTATALTTPAKKCALYTVTGGTASYAKTTISAEVSAENIAGIVDPALSGNVAAGGHFWVYCGKGDVVQFLGAAAAAAGLMVGTTTTVAGGLVSIGAVGTAVTITKLLAGVGIVLDATTAASDTGTLRLLGPA